MNKTDFAFPFFATYFSLLKVDDMESDYETLLKMRWILMKPGVFEDAQEVKY